MIYSSVTSLKLFFFFLQPMFLYDPSPVLNQSYLPSNMRSGPPDGPPPSATPPMQALQASYGNFGGSVGSHNQSVYPTGSNQGGNLQPLHVAVAPNPQALQNMQSATPHLGFQFASPALGVQGYNSQVRSYLLRSLITQLIGR